MIVKRDRSAVKYQDVKDQYVALANHIGMKSCVVVELEELLEQCKDVAKEPEGGQVFVKTLGEIDRKIDRLMDALAESSDMIITYVNYAIERLVRQRKKFLSSPP